MRLGQLHQTKEYIRQKRQYRLWKRVVTGLACMTVFTTTYMLILPAITLEETACCGIEEHCHDTSCYQNMLVCDIEDESHIHADECYEEMLICQKEEHEHTLECYLEQNTETTSENGDVSEDLSEDSVESPDDGEASADGVIDSVTDTDGEGTVEDEEIEEESGKSEEEQLTGEEEQFSLAAEDNLSLGPAPDYIGDIDKSNEWQIVAEEYAGNDNSNKIGYDTDEDGVNDVLLQKNVVPTKNENEFLVYLSITKQMTWDELLAQSQLGLTTQGKWTDSDVGKVVNTNAIGGNKSNVLQPGMGQRNYQATIHLSRNGDVVHTFTGWYNGTTPNASNCTGYIILNGLNNKAIIASAKVNLHQDGSGSGGTLEYTIDLDKLSENGIAYAVNKIELNSVEDELGDYMIYEGSVKCDGGVSESVGVLTWNITENPDIEGTSYENPKTGYMENVAQLVYKVKLDVTQDGFNSCGDNMNSIVEDKESYAVNKYAKLNYLMNNESYTQDFPVPYVRGLLYNITFDKIGNDTDEKLAGAVFGLYESNSETPVKKSYGSDYQITTAAGETSRFTDLPYGKYIIKELSPPLGYSIGSISQWNIELCYTTDPDDLSKDSEQPSNLRYSKNDVDGTIWQIVNSSGYILPETGGFGTLPFTLCGFGLMAGALMYRYYMRRKRGRRAE